MHIKIETTCLKQNILPGDFFSLSSAKSFSDNCFLYVYILSSIFLILSLSNATSTLRASSMLLGGFSETFSGNSENDFKLSIMLCSSF